MEEELQEFNEWFRRIKKHMAKREGKSLCRLCGVEIHRGYVYCFKCQEEIDDALCSHDHWPFGG